MLQDDKVDILSFNYSFNPSEYLNQAMCMNIPIQLVYGDGDIIGNWSTGMKVLKEKCDFKNKEEFLAQDWTKSNETMLIKEMSNIKVVRFTNSGHIISFDNDKLLDELIKDFVIKNV